MKSLNSRTRASDLQEQPRSTDSQLQDSQRQSSKRLGSRRLSKRSLLLIEKGSFGCADVERLLSDYLDRELPSALSARVSEHICSCDKCEQFAGSYQFIIELAREIGADRLDPKTNPAPLVDLPSVEASLEKALETGLPRGVGARLRAHLNQKLGIELDQ